MKAITPDWDPRWRARGDLLIVLILTATLAPALASPAAGAEDERTVLRAIAEGYLHNRESFPQFTCRYRIAKGRAASYEQAVDGDLANPVTADILWVVSGDKERHSVSTNDAALRENAARSVQADGSTVVVVPIASEDYLTDGRRQFRHSSGLANLFGVGSSDHRLSTNPFSMGVMGEGESRTPAALIQQKLNEPNPCRLRGRESVLGYGALVVEIPSRDGTQVLTYYLDPERGYLPIRKDAETRGQVESRTMITEARDCGDDRWFPMRSVRITNPEGEPPYYVQLIDVLELDVESVPDEDLFAVELPAGTRVVDRSDPKSQFESEEPMSVDLNDLQGIELAAARQARGETPNVEQASESSLLLVLLAAAAVLIAGVSVWRYRARA